MKGLLLLLALCGSANAIDISATGASSVSKQVIYPSTITLSNNGATVTAAAPLTIQMNSGAGFTSLTPYQDAVEVSNGTNNGTTAFSCDQKGAGICLFNFNMTGTNDDGSIAYDSTGAADALILKVGANTERARLTSTGLHIGAAGNPTGPLDIDSTTQGLGLPQLTQVQVRAATPGRTGMLIYNSNVGVICYSSGTVIMGWARIDNASNGCGQ